MTLAASAELRTQGKVTLSGRNSSLFVGGDISMQGGISTSSGPGAAAEGVAMRFAGISEWKISSPPGTTHDGLIAEHGVNTTLGMFEVPGCAFRM